MRLGSRPFPMVLLVVAPLASGCDSSQAPRTESEPAGTRATIFFMAEDGAHEAEYEVVDDHIVVDDDIGLGPPEEAWAEHATIAAWIASGEAPKATMDIRRRRKWDGGVIPYDFSDDEAWSQGRFERAQVEEAVAVWNSLTAITGVRWERAHLDRSASGVRFDYVGSGRCDSEVGRKQRRFDINLAPGCVLTLSPILHEMGHAAGLVHEHQRSDRNEHVRYAPEDHIGRRWDVRALEHLPRRADEVGAYDTQSIMHYASLPSRHRNPEPFPCLANRHTLTAWTAEGPSAASLSGFRSRYNRYIRLDGRGVLDPHEDFRVVDVNGDGYDDLLAELGTGLVWSSRGASGWRPLAPGGQSVAAALDEVVIGDFDATAGRDVLRVRGRAWTLYSSAGSAAGIEREKAARDVQTADVTGDGRDDVFVVNDDGSWSYAEGIDVLGPLTARASSDMGVDRVRLASLDGEGVDVVGIAGGVLSFCPEGSTEFRPVFAGASPPPLEVTSLDDLWFGHVDAPRSDPSSHIDLVAPSSGRDGSGVDAGAPVFVSDFGVTTAPELRAFRDRVGMPIWVDLRHGVAGYFESPDVVSFLSYGYIPWNGRIAASDVMALAIRYRDAGLATLTDKYPLPRSGDVHESETIFVAPNERIELEADFMAPSSIRTLVVSREHRVGVDTWELVASRTERFASEAVTLRDVFSAAEGTWRVRVFPSEPGAATPLDVAEWRFQVGRPGIER